MANQNQEFHFYKYLSFALKIFLISVLLLNLISCSKFTPKLPSSPPELFILGLDGATWDMIIPLQKMGQLPAFKRILSESSYGYLNTMMPTISPAIWTTMVTGVFYDKHGIQDWLESDASLRTTSNLRKAPALWQILPEYDKSVIMLNWWATWPAEKTKGVIISDRMRFQQIPDRSYPPGTLEKFFSQLPKPNPDQVIQKFTSSTYNDNLVSENKENAIKVLQTFQPEFKIPQKIKDKIKDLLYWFEIDEQNFALLDKLRNSYPADLFAAYIQGLDPMSHKYWKFMAPEEFPKFNNEETNWLGKIIPRYYSYYDEFLSSLLDKGSLGKQLLILSDHGFHKIQLKEVRILKCDLLLEKLGWLIKDENDEINWSESKVFCPPALKTLLGKKPPTSFSELPICPEFYLKINLIGRQDFGIVKQTEYNQVLEDCVKTLTNLKTQNNVGLFSKVQIMEQNSFVDISLKPNLKIFEQPDQLVLLPNDSVSVKDLFEMPTFAAHNDAPEGIFIFQSPYCQRNYNFSKSSEKDSYLGKAVINIADITPLVLYSMHLPIAKDMDGAIPSFLFQRDFLEKYPPAYKESYNYLMPKQEIQIPKDQDVDDEIKEQLKNLGYIN